MISFTDVAFIRDDRTILSNIQWSTQRGEQWVLLGRNGSGKTTLLEMINGYTFPSRGTIEVLGKTYGRTDIREVRKRIAYMSQALVEKLSLSDPLWEIVAGGAVGYLRFYEAIPQELKERAMERLEHVGLGGMCSQPFGTLSQGERKKALLARALIGDPELVIMDEPCSGLDLYERESFLKSVEAIGSGTSIIYVTHHLEEITPIFTHVALLHNGQITASGRKETVLTRELIQEAYGVSVTLDWEAGRPWAKVKASL